MRILVICDDRWHPADTVRKGLEPLTKRGFEFDFIENATEWSKERMDNYPVVLFSKSNNISSKDETHWMTEAAEQAFVDYVEQGRGLVAIHSGTAGYANTPLFRGLLGGVFTQHPEQCPVTVEPKKGYAVTKDVDSFTEKDEHYHMALDDKIADVFLMTSSEHGTQPGGWMRRQGKGRVGVFTPGHNLEVWLHPATQSLIENLLNWCAEGCL